MFKEFILKKMLASKLKDIPQSEQDKIMALASKRPDLLMKIAEEAKAKTDSGMDQMQAMMEVTKKYEVELKELLK